MIVLIKEYFPISVEILQVIDFLCFCLCQKFIYNLMEFFDFLSEYSDKKWVNHFFYVIPQPLTRRHSTLTVA